MQKLWEAIVNMVKGPMPELRQEGKRRVSKFGQRLMEIRKEFDDPIEKYKNLETVYVKDGKVTFDEQEKREEREDKAVLPGYVAGCDPYEPGKPSTHLSGFCGESGAYTTKGNISLGCYREEKHYHSHVGRAHEVRRAPYASRFSSHRRRAAERLEDRLTAASLAIRAGRGEK